MNIIASKYIESARTMCCFIASFLIIISSRSPTLHFVYSSTSEMSKYISRQYKQMMNVNFQR